MVNLVVATEDVMDLYSDVVAMSVDGIVKNIEQVKHEYGISTQIGWVDNDDGIATFEIDWYNDAPGVEDPHKNELTFIPYQFLSQYPDSDADFVENYSSNWLYYGKKLAETTVKLTPKVIYDWDAASNTFEDSGERTEKIDRSPSTDEVAPDNGWKIGCSAWYNQYGACLDVNDQPGVRIRVCKMSETTSTVTIKVSVSDVNEGVDADYYTTMKINLTEELVITDFNANGYTSQEYTLDKTFNDFGTIYEWNESMTIFVREGTTNAAWPYLTVTCNR